MYKHGDPIDLVYTWVDGSRPDYIELYSQYAQKDADLNPERYRDIYSLLKYSMRSVEKFVPWVRKIYVVTARPQVPEWLDTSNERVQVVHHDEIFDDPDYLPTFNYNVIESHIHNIPGLSRYFLYLNDDHLFGAKMELNDFFTPEGKVRVFGTLLGENLKYRIFEAKYDYIPLGFVEHTPSLIDKEAWGAMLQTEPEKVHATRSNKFREPADVCMEKLYRRYMLSNKSEESKAIMFWQLTKKSIFHKITNDHDGQLRKISTIEKKRPKFICLNDDQRLNPNPKVIDRVKTFLNDYYPEPSQFEKTS